MVKIKDLKVGSIVKMQHGSKHEYMKGAFDHHAQRYALMPYSEGAREMSVAGDLAVVVRVEL